MFWGFLGAISDNIDEVTIVETVQLRCLIQESEIPVCPNPWLAIAKIVFRFGEAGALQIGHAVGGQQL